MSAGGGRLELRDGLRVASVGLRARPMRAALSALGIAIGMMGCMAALGFVLPGAALGSVLNHGRTAGAASALYGTIVFFIGAISTILVGWIGSESPVAMTSLS